MSVCPSCKSEVDDGQWCDACGICADCCVLTIRGHVRHRLQIEDAAEDDGWDLSDMEDDRYFWDR